MENTKQYLKDRDILPRISFKDKQPHTVELVKDKIDTITDQQGNQKEGIKFLVKEDGVIKSFFTTSVGLLQQLSDKKKGDVVTVEMKSKKDDSGEYKSYYTVDSDSGEDIPVIDEHEGDTEIPY